MDMRGFNQAWETAYLSARVLKIAEAVENENYESALDMLAMIKDKATRAEKLIKDAQTETTNQ